MISRVYLKDCLSFNEVDLEFASGLNVFTGPSGAGKSILMQEILSLFAINELKSSTAEVVISNNLIEDESFDIQKGEDIIIKAFKKDKIRYFLNNQSISKKRLFEFSSNLIKYLNLKDTSDFDSAKLLDFLDKLSLKNSLEFKEIKNQFDEKYKRYSLIKRELDKICEDEKRLQNLKEFAKFEIDKIEAINPSIDEYEELNEIKKKLSKKDKIEDAIKKASGVLQFNSYVNNALELLEVDSSFYDDTINELNNVFERFNDSLYELDDLNVENVLDRIEKLSSLQKRFGSIKEAIEYKEEKIKELQGYENISFQKNSLEKELEILQNDLTKLSFEISKYRKNSSLILEGRINYYLKFLYLSDAKIIFNKKNLDEYGMDEITFELKGVDLNTISSGEYNRLRLSLLTTISEYDIVENGILFLDEIDANLSGKESEAISKVLETLSKKYQIFAISHQPQLTSSANQHFLVDKQNGVSNVKLLDKKQRVDEIARMISGKDVTLQALEFAANILK